MKKSFLLTALLCASTQFFGQQRKNDIMADPILAISADLLNISYEHIPNANFGFGANYVKYLGSDEGNFSQFSAFARYYTTERKYGQGFFVEAYIPINSYDSTTTTYNNNTNYPTTKTKNNTSSGLGFGFGGKWATRQNLVFELSLGIGRNFINTNNDAEIKINGKAMFGVGYRF